MSIENNREKEQNSKRIEKVNEMDNVATVPNKVSLVDFIRINKEKISKITPKNPSISKDDIWRKEDFWDKDYEEKQGK